MYTEKPNLRKNHVLQHEGEKHIEDILQNAPYIQLFEKFPHKNPPPWKSSLLPGERRHLFNDRKILDDKHLNQLAEITAGFYNTIFELPARFRFHGTERSDYKPGRKRASGA